MTFKTLNMTKPITFLISFCLLFCFACELGEQDTSTDTSSSTDDTSDSTYDDPNSVATVYNHANYGGEHLPLNEGFHKGPLTIGHDAVSSVKIKAGYMITLYEGSPNSGNQLTIKSNTPDLSKTDIHFDDKTSSIFVEKIPHEDFVYDHGLEHDDRCHDTGSEEFSITKFTGSMGINQVLKEKDNLISANLKYAMTVTSDGRLIVEEILERALCNDGRIVVFHAKEIWSNTSEGHDPALDYYLTLQKDGNVCIYSGEKDFVWCAMTNEKDGKHLDLTNFGEIELITDKGKNVFKNDAI